VGLAAWGGVVSFLHKVKIGETHKFNLTELIGEVLTSGFAGILTFYLCEAAKFDAMWTAAMVGISGHMGARALYHVENLFNKIIDLKSSGSSGR
jgi:hypothetical protein